MNDNPTHEEMLAIAAQREAENEVIVAKVLELVARELKGKLYTVLVTDKYKEHKEIVIRYAEQKR